jgi:hypothetical protein
MIGFDSQIKELRTIIEETKARKLPSKKSLDFFCVVLEVNTRIRELESTIEVLERTQKFFEIQEII